MYGWPACKQCLPPVWALHISTVRLCPYNTKDALCYCRRNLLQSGLDVSFRVGGFSSYDGASQAFATLQDDKAHFVSNVNAAAAATGIPLVLSGLQFTQDASIDILRTAPPPSSPPPPPGTPAKAAQPPPPPGTPGKVPQPPPSSSPPPPVVTTASTLGSPPTAQSAADRLPGEHDTSISVTLELRHEPPQHQTLECVILGPAALSQLLPVQLQCSGLPLSG